MTADALVKVDQLSIGFSSSDRKQPILAVENVTFEMMKGETFGLVGESGCGKTLTSLAIMGLLPDNAAIQHGEIRFQGQVFSRLKEKEKNRYRGNRIAMIFQDPMNSLSPFFTVGNQMIEGMRWHLGLSKKLACLRAIDLLKKVGIPSPEYVFDQYPSKLSGGMRQRVMIAIAISCEPDLLIADEPTTALDVTTQAQILRLLQQLQKETDLGIILISHDLGVISDMCERMAVMYAGQIVEEGQTEALLNEPQHPYTLALVNATPRLDQKAERFYQVPGQVPKLGEWGEGCRFQSRCSAATEACGIMAPLNEQSSTHKVRCWNPIAVPGTGLEVSV